MGGGCRNLGLGLHGIPKPPFSRGLSRPTLELLLSPDAPRPSPWVVRWAHLFSREGRVLDLACGHGRHALWLAQQGFEVDAVDADESALAAIRAHATPSLVRTECLDLEGETWPLAGRQYDAVVVTNYLWRPRWSDLMALVKPGGCLVYETFSQHQALIGRPRSDAFLLAPAELLERVQGWHVLAFEDGYEADTPKFVQRIVAVRPMQGGLGEWQRHVLKS